LASASSRGSPFPSPQLPWLLLCSHLAASPPWPIHAGSTSGAGGARTRGRRAGLEGGGGSAAAAAAEGGDEVRVRSWNWIELGGKVALQPPACSRRLSPASERRPQICRSCRQQSAATESAATWCAHHTGRQQ